MLQQATGKKGSRSSRSMSVPMAHDMTRNLANNDKYMPARQVTSELAMRDAAFEERQKQFDESTMPGACADDERLAETHNSPRTKNLFDEMKSRQMELAPGVEV